MYESAYQNHSHKLQGPHGTPNNHEQPVLETSSPGETLRHVPLCGSP